jgi:chitinase
LIQFLLSGYRTFISNAPIRDFSFPIKHRDKIADPKNIDFRKVQRVNYAFFQPDAQGNIYGTDRWADPQLLFGPYTEKLMGGIQRCSYDGPEEVNCAYHEHNSGIIYLAHQAGAEVYPSIGELFLSIIITTVDSFNS